MDTFIRSCCPLEATLLIRMGTHQREYFWRINSISFQNYTSFCKSFINIAFNGLHRRITSKVRHQFNIKVNVLLHSMISFTRISDETSYFLLWSSFLLFTILWNHGSRIHIPFPSWWLIFSVSIEPSSVSFIYFALCMSWRILPFDRDLRGIFS